MFSQLFLALSFLMPVPLHEETVDLGKQTLWVEDKEVQISGPEQALEAFVQKSYQGPSPRGLNLGFKKGPVWYLARIQNDLDQRRFVLNFEYAQLDLIDVWVLTEEGMSSFPQQGDLVPFKQRSIEARTSNVRFDLAQGKEAFILYRVRTDTTMLADARLYTEDEFNRIQIHSNAILWAIWGMMGIMLVYHFFLWITLRHGLYLLYCLYIGVGIIAQTSIQGHLYQYLPWVPPAFTNLNTTWSHFFILTMMLYTSHFLALKKFSLGAWKALNIVAIIVGLVFLALPLGGWMAYMKAFSGMIILAPITIFIVAWIAFFKGQRAARFFIAAFAFFLGSIVIVLLRNIGLIPFSPLISFALPIGNAIQIMLMGLALGDRMRMMEEAARLAERQRAEEEAQHKAEVLAMNASLERRVAEQTRDIRSMLENTKIGLFSVTESLQVHKDYARYLETILEDQSIRERPLQELLLSKSKLGADSKDRLMAALSSALGEDEINFEANSSCLPREIEIHVSGKDKFLDLDWSPVLNDAGHVEKILVSLRDVTETLQLRKEAEEGRRSLKLLGELLKMGPDRFEKFDQNLAETLEAIDRIYSEGKASQSLGYDGLRIMYVGLHTVKGVARMFQLDELTETIHRAEECIHQKTQISHREYMDFGQAINLIQLSREDYRKAIAPLKALQDQSKGRDGSSARNLQTLFVEVEKMVSELGESLGKPGCKVELDLPSDQELSPKFFSAMEKALVHLIRNSLDHGIEKPEERLAKGKNAEGRIRVYVDSKGRLCLGDDGAGLNLRKLKEKAASLGRGVSSQVELMELIFESGVSTKEAADTISGRGVGMDAVRLFLQEAGASIQIVPELQDGDFVRFHFAIELPGSGILNDSRAS